MTSKYKPAEKIKKIYGVSTSTLRRWNDKGDVAYITMPGGKRLYSTDDIDNIFGRESTQKKKICYARVSSEKQKDDLGRQRAYLVSEFPDHEIITDIGSGLNWKRRGFTSLLERVYARDIEEVVVTRKDRLCRFAYELVEWIFSKHDVKLVVLGSDVGSNDPDTGELAEDLLSIVTEREKLKKWMGTAKWTYNRALDLIKNGESRTKKNLRQKCIKVENFRHENTWVLETPYGVRDEVLIELLEAGEYAFLKNIRTSEKLPDINHAVNIIRDSFKRFYVCVPVPIKEQYRENDDFISIDPGVRTFMTGYDPKGKIFEYGKGDISRVYRLCKRHDEYQSQRSVLKGGSNKRERYKLKRKMLKIHDKIKNLIRDCHHKIVKELCENYNTILLPRFETKNMVRKKDKELDNQESKSIKNHKKKFKRKIKSKTARMMLTWSHHRFQQHLVHKIREYPGRLLILCDEHYTSKTCGNCGYIKHNLGGAKIYRCNRCGFEIDRDHNGARNILLKHLSQRDLTLGPTPFE
ncbi:8566_t:CDS:2 [Scutellospora calospora]|uniref:8566_t:CDS:1 n=1 Tax=Scutellospora calospora TaxID=85575 RepID=A0ACA9JUI0_9GLOM|nr:8566_t:CDS:2 [Scutellospora calospora]